MSERMDEKSGEKLEFKSGDIKILMGKRDKETNESFQYQQNVEGRPAYAKGQTPPVNTARTQVVQPRATSEEPFDESIFHHSFSTTQIRHRFIRKVYLLLFILLTFTTGVILLFVFEKNTNNFAREYYYIGLAMLLASLIFYILLACIKTLRTTSPQNFIFLLILTVLSAVGFGFIAACYAKHVVLYSAATTAGVCLLITLVACQTRVDMTGWGIYLCIALIIVILYGIIIFILQLTIGIPKIVYIICGGLFVLLCCMYFMYVTQLIIGGKKYEISPEDYMLGTIMLYVEILLIFSCFLDIFGSCM